MVCPGPKQRRSSRVEPGPRRCLTAVTREHCALLPSVMGKRKGKFISSGLLSGLHPRLPSGQGSVCASVSPRAELSSGRVGAVRTETGLSRTVQDCPRGWLRVTGAQPRWARTSALQCGSLLWKKPRDHKDFKIETVSFAPHLKMSGKYRPATSKGLPEGKCVAVTPLLPCKMEDGLTVF